MSAHKTQAQYVAEARARQRAAGLRAIEAALHLDDIATLDRLKGRLGVSSRSDVLRILIAKADPDTLSPADAAVLKKDAA